MRGYTLAPAGTAYTLAAFDRPDPVPAPGRVVVRVRAAAVNYRDHIILHNLAGRDVIGRVPLSDGAGEVVAVGPGVTGWKVGDRVAGCFFQGWRGGRFDMAYHKTDLGGSIDGMLAERVELDAAGLVAVPDYLTFEEAACLPCAGLTAYYALVVRGGLAAGDTVVTLGTGGVSAFAVQIAHAAGATAYVTSSSDAKIARAVGLGAAAGVNYLTHPDWDREILALTGGKGADHVLEIGGPGTLGRSLGCLAAGGHLALIGVLTGFGPSNASLFPAAVKNARVSGIYVGSRADFEAFTAFLTAHRIRPVIDRVYPLADAAEAYAALAAGGQFGKIVIAL